MRVYYKLKSNQEWETLKRFVKSEGIELCKNFESSGIDTFPFAFIKENNRIVGTYILPDGEVIADTIGGFIDAIITHLVNKPAKFSMKISHDFRASYNQGDDYVMIGDEHKVSLSVIEELASKIKELNNN